MSTMSTDDPIGPRDRTPSTRNAPFFALQVLAGLAVIGLGVYFATTGRWAMGGVFGGIGISILPFPVAGLIGAVVCLGFAGAGWYFGRFGALVAALVVVLSIVTIAERFRRV